MGVSLNMGSHANRIKETERIFMDIIKSDGQKLLLPSHQIWIWEAEAVQGDKKTGEEKKKLLVGWTTTGRNPLQWSRVGGINISKEYGLKIPFSMVMCHLLEGFKDFHGYFAPSIKQLP